MKIQHRLILILFLIAIFLPIIHQQVNATDPVYDWDFTVGPLQDRSWFLQGIIPSGTTFYGEITVTQEDIFFYVLDQDDYNGKDTSNPIFDLGEISGFYTFQFEVPYDDVYYFIFGNMDALLASASVSGWVSYDNTAPSVTLDVSSNYVREGEEFTISISAIDNFEISTYSVYYDDGAYLVSGYPVFDQSFIRTITTSRSQAGSYILYVVVTDIAGKSTTKYTTINVYEPDASMPTDAGPAGPTPPPLSSLPLPTLFVGFLVVILIGIGVIVMKRRKETVDFTDMEVVTP